MTAEQISDFVNKFFTDLNTDQSVLDEWNGITVQKSLKKLTKKLEKKNDGKVKPKHVKSAYMYFCSENRPLLLKGGVSPKDIMSVLGKEWVKLKTNVKLGNPDAISTMEKFTEMANSDKQRYAHEKESIAPVKPKKASSAYILFSKDYRTSVKERNPDMSQQDIMKEIGKAWSEMKSKNPQKYSEYQKMAERLKQELEENNPSEKPVSKAPAKPKAKEPKAKEPKAKATSGSESDSDSDISEEISDVENSDN